MALKAAGSLIPVAGRSSVRPLARSCHNIGDKIESEIANYSNELPDLPSGFPFELKVPLCSEEILMEGRYQNERVRVKSPMGTIDLDNGYGPFLPMTVRVDKGTFEVISFVNAKRDQLHIQQVIVRNYNTDMKDYTEYFRSRGITPKAISFMYDCLGFGKKKS